MTTVRLPLNRYREKLIDAFIDTIAATTPPERLKWTRSNLSRTINEYGDSKRFRDWLFADGIMLVRDKKVWYLQFLTETNSSIFVLIWS